MHPDDERLTCELCIYKGREVRHIPGIGDRCTLCVPKYDKNQIRETRREAVDGREPQHSQLVEFLADNPHYISDAITFAESSGFRRGVRMGRMQVQKILDQLNEMFSEE